MDEISFRQMILATTTSGEKMVGLIVGERETFEDAATHGLAVELAQVRNVTIQEVQKPAGNGQVMVAMTINLMALPPFTFPVPRQHVRLAGWIYIEDHEELHPTMTKLIAQAEQRELEMRASSSGIQLASGGHPGGMP